MSNIFIKTLTFFSAMICILEVFGQSEQIKGTVSTSDGKMAEMVKVGLKNTDYKTVSDTDGSFVFTAIPYGKYIVIMQLSGVETQTKEIEVNQPTIDIQFILEENKLDLEEILITAYKSENERTTSVGKIPIKPMDMPQSTAVIGRELLEKQQTLYLSDALKNTNGVYIMGNSGGYQEEIAARGFAFKSSNTFKNGVRFNNSVMPEMSSLERLEIMKGSTAILYGNVAAGGVLNLVTKKPSFEKGGSVSMRLGSYELYKPIIDLYGPVNEKKTVAFRLNSSYEKSRSFRDVVAAERFYINPSLLFKIGAKTELLLESDYLNDDRTADFGVGAINYELIDIPRSTFLGTSWGYMKSEQLSGTATVSHQFNEKWQLKSTTAMQVFKNDLFATQRPNGGGEFIQEDGMWTRGLQRRKTSDDYYISQLDLIGKFKTGTIAHTVLVGADIDQYNTHSIAYDNVSAYDSINVFNVSQYPQRADIPDPALNTNTSTPISRAGTYAQDLIAVGEKIKVLLGGRISYIETRGSVYSYKKDQTTTSETLYNHAFSPRVGLVYQPIKTMAIFGSYSNSFTPNSGVDINGNTLDPSYIDQYEAGIKNDFFKGLLSVNVTAYQIIQANLAQTSLENGNTNSNIKELAGEVRSQGIELDLVSKTWNGLSFIGGYSFNETKYTKTNTYIVGSRLLYNPQNTANASVYYSFLKGKLKGLNIGFSSLYFGKRSAGRLTRVTVENDDRKPIAIPDYTQLDATIGYTYNNVSVRFKVSNILDALSYNVHDDNSVNPIAPRMFAGTVTVRF